MCVCQGGWGGALPRHSSSISPQIRSEENATTLRRHYDTPREDSPPSDTNIIFPISTQQGGPAHYLEMPPRHYICWNGDIRRIVLFRNIFESISTYIQNLAKDNRDPSHLAGVSLRGRWGGGEEEGLICFCAASTLLLLVLVGKMICVGGGVAAACRRCYERLRSFVGLVRRRRTHSHCFWFFFGVGVVRGLLYVAE